MNYANEVIQEKYGVGPVPTYRNDQFDEMIQTEKPDVVIVTSIDRINKNELISKDTMARLPSR